MDGVHVRFDCGEELYAARGTRSGGWLKQFEGAAGFEVFCDAQA
jgi:hypothetical protein